MKKPTKKTRDSIEEIFRHFLTNFDMILKTNITQNEIEDIIKARYALVHKINSTKFSEEELKTMSECRLMLDVINDFCETYAALRIDKYLGDM
jgi:hypothetical protein